MQSYQLFINVTKEINLKVGKLGRFIFPIGSYVYTGAASLIDRNIPPYATGYGNRFEVKGVNIVGLKRQNFSRESIGEILEAHRIFYRSELKNDEALRIIEETFGESRAIRAFLDFIYNAEGSGKH